MVWMNPPYSRLAEAVEKVARDQAHAVLVSPEWTKRKWHKEARAMEVRHLMWPRGTKVFEMPGHTLPGPDALTTFDPRRDRAGSLPGGENGPGGGSRGPSAPKGTKKGQKPLTADRTAMDRLRDREKKVSPQAQDSAEPPTTGQTTQVQSQAKEAQLGKSKSVKFGGSEVHVIPEEEVEVIQGPCCRVPVVGVSGGNQGC